MSQINKTATDPELTEQDKNWELGYEMVRNKRII